MNINEIVEFVEEWNKEGGFDKPVHNDEEFLATIRQQGLIILEEVLEMLDGAGLALTQAPAFCEYHSDMNEVLDGAADTLFTVARLPSLFKNYNIDLLAATTEVCKNNDLKFLEKNESNLEKMLVTVENREGDCSINTSTKGRIFLTRDSDGKLIKPIGHPRVELTQFLDNRKNNVETPQKILEILAAEAQEHNMGY